MRLIALGAISSTPPGNPDSEERTITSALPQNAVVVDYNTVFTSVSKPTNVTFTLDDNSQISLPVTWIEGTYDETVAGTYVVDGEITLPLPSGIVNPTDVMASLSITVNADITYDFYVETTGNDSTGDGSSGFPFLTIQRAITAAVSAGGSKTIKVGAGTFTSTSTTGRISLPANISIIGEGATTILQTDATLYDSTSNDNSKYLIQLLSGGATSTTQTLRNFRINGLKSGSTRLNHGGISISNRNGTGTGIIISGVTIDDHLRGGIFILNSSNIRITQCILSDNSHNSSFSLGDFIVGGTTSNVEIDNCTITDNYGYAFKISGSTVPTITNLRFHHNTVAVSRLTAGGQVAIGAELHDCRLIGCEINNNYFYGNISVVANESIASNGVQTVRIHHNTIDMQTAYSGITTPWGNSGNPLELTIHDCEVDNNYFKGGANAAIATWNASETTVKRNWNIHNNVFEGQSASFPTGIVRSNFVGLESVNFYNNTIVTSGPGTLVWFYIANGNNRNPAPTGSNINCINNVCIDTSGGTQYGNRIVWLEGGATLSNFVFTYNYVQNMSTSIPSGTSNNNISGNPQLQLSGAKPDPYFRPLPASPVIGTGATLSASFPGASTTRGAYLYADPTQSGEIDTVDNIAGINVNTGTTWAEVLAMLPTTIMVTLDNNERVSLEIIWDQGTYDGNVEDTYSIEGELQLLPGIDNTANNVAQVEITVTDAVYDIDDSFTSFSGWTLQDPSGLVQLTATSDGSDLTIDGDDGLNDERIVHDTFVDDSDNLEIILDHTILESSATSYGIGIGIQNTVIPDPNKGVHLNFTTTNTVSQGTLAIFSGDGTTSNTSFIQRPPAPTQLTIVVGRAYQSILTRELQGTDVLWTASTRDIVTDITVQTSWLEVGGGSMAYQSTNKLAIFHFGGQQKINRVRVVKSNAAGQTANVIINETFQSASLPAGWTEQDAGNTITITPNDPGLTFTGSPFTRASKNLAYDTVIGTSVTDWKITLVYQYTGTAGRGLTVGTKNSVNPNPNRFVTGTLCNSGDPGKVQIWSGDGTTSLDAQTQQAMSSSSLSMIADTNYVVQFERAYDGTDAVYTITAWKESDSGTTVSVQWTETGADTKSQAYYATSNWIIAQVAGTNKVISYKVELV